MFILHCLHILVLYYKTGVTQAFTFRWSSCEQNGRAGWGSRPWLALDRRGYKLAPRIETSPSDAMFTTKKVERGWGRKASL